MRGTKVMAELEQWIKQIVREEIDKQTTGGSLITLSSAALKLHVHVNTARRWADIGLLPVLRIGPRGDRRFRLKDVEELIGRKRLTR